MPVNPVNSENRLNPIATAEELTAGLGQDESTPAGGSDWERLARIVLGRANRRARGVGSSRASSPESSRASSLPSPLASPRETATAHLEEIEQAAESAGLAATKAKAAQTLARWWTKSFGDEQSPEWSSGPDRWREELVALKGVSHELADRVLLAVARMPVWPTSRASIRVGCRHGWIDPGAEYDEWQGLFVRALEADVARLARLSATIDRVGKEHCGPKPNCDGCPLAPLLPPGGPVEVDSEA